MPPFYNFYLTSNAGFNEGWINFFVVNNTFVNDQLAADAIPSFALGAWVNKKG